ncbi:MAG: sugar ABC transporter permease [Candidatus Hydrogenedentota bacterium]
MICRAITVGLLLSGAIITLYPFAWMIGTAFQSETQSALTRLWFWPADWHWENVAETFRAAPFGRYFYNTMITSVVVTVSVVLTSLSAGYAFARLQFPGRRGLFALILVTMMIPFEVALIPNFLLIRALNWYDTFAALIVPWCANAFSIFLLRQAFLGLPRDYFDAARVDGCGHLRFLARIAAPLVKPMLSTVGLFTFLGSYNALLWPIIVTQSESMRVVQYGLTVFWGSAGVQMNLLMCASAIVTAPTVALYFLAQRHFVDSALNAGIKG